MKGRSVGIVGLGCYSPPGRLTNLDLEKMVDTSDEWIRARTGILERRIVSEDTSTSDMAVIAGSRALEEAGVKPEEVDLIIMSTASPDMPFPATGCLVQERLGAWNSAAFDLEAGCSGFIYALAVGSQFIASDVYDTVLVIGAETLSKITNWEDRNTCVLFGDGAGAALLTAVPGGTGILSIDLGADGSCGDILKLPAGGSRLPASKETVEQKLHTIHMEGREVFKHAIKRMEESARKALEKAGAKIEDVDLLVPHQANIRIIEATAKRLGIDWEKVFVNLELYGNTSCASIPIALCEAKEQGRLRAGDLVVIVAIGAGLTWGASVVRWNTNGKEG